MVLHTKCSSALAGKISFEMAKFFWSIAVTFAAMFATYIDGIKDPYALTDQSISLFFSGFGAIIVGLVVSKSQASSSFVVEVDAHKLLVSVFMIFFLFLVIIGLGQQRNPSDPSYWISFGRTLVGTISLGIGLSLAEGFLIRGVKDGQ